MSYNSKPRRVPRCEPTHSAAREQHVLEQHNKEVHTEIRPYKCGTCGKGFKWKSNLYKHKRIHRSERPYKCEFCKKAFKKFKGTQGGDTYHKCIVCEKVFKTKQNMRCHINTDHPRERLYKCNQCLSVFTRHYSLNNHINRVHIDKKHLCKICGKAFPTKNEKDRHSVVHCDKKPYVCSTCGKAYKRKGSLVVHELRITWVVLRRTNRE